jgi:superfamily II DNA helicase RecQ
MLHLNRNGITALSYHSHLSSSKREENHKRFMLGKKRGVVLA